MRYSNPIATLFIGCGAGCVVLFALIMVLFLSLKPAGSIPDMPPNMQTASGPISPAPSQLSSETVEHRLAVKDVGKEVEENSPRVRQFAAVLDSLEAKCQEDREQIGQTIITVHDTLSKRGVVKEADLLDIANSLDNSIPEKSETKGKIADIGAAYIVRYSPKK